MNTMLAAILGGWEWVVLIFAVLLLFGSKRIPDLARSLGASIKEFKKGARDVSDEIQSAGDDRPVSPNKPAASSPPPGQAVSQSSNPPKA